MRVCRLQLVVQILLTHLLYSRGVTKDLIFPCETRCQVNFTCICTNHSFAPIAQTETGHTTAFDAEGDPEDSLELFGWNSFRSKR